MRDLLSTRHDLEEISGEPVQLRARHLRDVWTVADQLQRRGVGPVVGLARLLMSPEPDTLPGATKNLDRVKLATRYAATLPIDKKLLRCLANANQWRLAQVLLGEFIGQRRSGGGGDVDVDGDQFGLDGQAGRVVLGRP